MSTESTNQTQPEPSKAKKIIAELHQNFWDVIDLFCDVQREAEILHMQGKVGEYTLRKMKAAMPVTAIIVYDDGRVTPIVRRRTLELSGMSVQHLGPNNVYIDTTGDVMRKLVEAIEDERQDSDA